MNKWMSIKRTNLRKDLKECQHVRRIWESKWAEDQRVSPGPMWKWLVTMARALSVEWRGQQPEWSALNLARAWEHVDSKCRQVIGKLCHGKKTLWMQEREGMTAGTYTWVLRKLLVRTSALRVTQKTDPEEGSTFWLTTLIKYARKNGLEVQRALRR